MRFRPSWLVVAGVLQGTILAWFAQGSAVPTIGPVDAAAYDGQGVVRVVGLVQGVHASPDSTRLSLQMDGHRLDAFVPGALHALEGSWAEATGRIARLSGRLTLMVQDASSISVTPAPGVATPSWSDVANDPGAWLGEPILLQGTVQGGDLRDGDGHHVALGVGAWPKNGAVEATVTVSYDASCLCHRLDASNVTLVGTRWRS